MDIPSGYLPPRLCTLRKWPNFAGYGFNLHAEKGKPGQYVGKVDPNSPAELGGLKPKYFLIEVNYDNVEELNHQMVVERIKKNPDHVTMLVAHIDTYKYCKENNMPIRSDMPNIDIFCTPEVQPEENDSSHNQNSSSAEVSEHDNAAGGDRTDHHHPEEAPQVAATAVITEASPPPSPSPPPPQSLTPQQARTPTESPAQTPPPAQRHAAPAAAAPADPVGNISLEEMRAKLGKNKRTQVKMSPSTFSEKSHLFQTM